MTTYSAVEQRYIEETLPAKIRRACEAADSLETAAQALADAVFEEFSTSVLVRVFATVPYRGLPADTQTLVRGLADGIGIAALIRDWTPVFSLVGTRGTKADWNDRKKSAQHFGLPLVSAAFVAQISMMSRLLDEIGVGSSWLGDGSRSTHPARNAAGVFHTEDARTTTDAQGRLVVPAQDFVADHDVKTVFGVGGTYPNGTLVSLLCFTAEHIDRPTAERYLPLLLAFRSNTLQAVDTERLFRGAA